MLLNAVNFIPKPFCIFFLMVPVPHFNNIIFHHLIRIIPQSVFCKCTTNRQITLRFFATLSIQNWLGIFSHIRLRYEMLFIQKHICTLIVKTYLHHSCEYRVYIGRIIRLIVGRLAELRFNA